MERNLLEQKVKDIIVDNIGLDVEEIKDDSNFKNDLGFDSLDEIELVMEIEKEFSINLPDGELENINIFSECINYLLTKKL